MLCVAIGGVDSYDFHALEVDPVHGRAAQGRRDRRGGRAGAARRRGLEGDGGRLAGRGGWDPRCSRRACAAARRWPSRRRSATATRRRSRCASGSRSRSPTASSTPTASRRRCCCMNGLVGDFTFAARLKGEAEPLSTLFYLPPNPNVVYSAALMSKAEEMFLTGKAPVPDRADAADDGPGRGRHAVAGRAGRSGSRRRTWPSAIRRRGSRCSGGVSMVSRDMRWVSCLTRRLTSPVRPAAPPPATGDVSRRIRQDTAQGMSFVPALGVNCRGIAGRAAGVNRPG